MPTTVLYALTDPTAAEAVRAAAGALDLEARVWRRREGDEPSHQVRAAAGLVWDLDDLNPAALPDLHRLRADRPALPVLLLLPPRPGAIALAGEIGPRFPRVVTRGYWQRAEDRAFLRTFLLDAASRAPAARALEFALEPVPSSSLLLERTVEAILRRALADAAPSIPELAVDLGYSERQLRWRWRQDWLRPGHLVSWVRMLLFGTIGAADGRPPTVVARQFGCDEKRFAKWRQTLGLPPLGTENPERALDIIRAAYSAAWEAGKVSAGDRSA